MKPSFFVERDLAFHHSPSLKSKNKRIHNMRTKNNQVLFICFFAEGLDWAGKRNMTFILEVEPSENATALPARWLSSNTENWVKHFHFHTERKFLPFAWVWAQSNKTQQEKWFSNIKRYITSNIVILTPQELSFFLLSWMTNHLHEYHHKDTRLLQCSHVPLLLLMQKANG